jgi:antitoxin ParD1/3/4
MTVSIVKWFCNEIFRTMVAQLANASQALARVCRPAKVDSAPGGVDTNSWYRLSMSKNTSFSLDEHYSAFIDEEVASGRYRSASDVVRTALRLLEDRETRLLALRRALITGERSGESTPFDFDEFVARKRAEDPRQR